MSPEAFARHSAMDARKHKLTGGDYVINFPEEGFAQIEKTIKANRKKYWTIQFASEELFQSVKKYFNASQKNQEGVRVERQQLVVEMLNGDYGKVHKGQFGDLKLSMSNTDFEEPEEEEIDFGDLDDLDFSFM